MFLNLKSVFNTFETAVARCIAIHGQGSCKFRHVLEKHHCPVFVQKRIALRVFP